MNPICPHKSSSWLLRHIQPLHKHLVSGLILDTREHYTSTPANTTRQHTLFIYPTSPDLSTPDTRTPHTMPQAPSLPDSHPKQPPTMSALRRGMKRKASEPAEAKQVKRVQQNSQKESNITEASDNFEFEYRVLEVGGSIQRPATRQRGIDHADGYELYQKSFATAGLSRCASRFWVYTSFAASGFSVQRK
jgi:hypothetical protein